MAIATGAGDGTPLPASENIVYGKVIIKGTFVGIPNLLVVVYDIDAARQEQADEDLDAVISNAAARAWIDFPGDRIGSVLTARDGSFTLGYRDAAFNRTPAGEHRPDLVFFVLAPDVRVGDTYLGQPVPQRLLHYAYVARKDAGQREALIVALEPALLDQRGIAYPGSASARGIDPASLLAAQQQRTARKIELVRTAVAGHLDKYRRLAEVKRENWRWFMPLSGFTETNFTRDAAAVPALQRRAMADDAVRLASMPGLAGFYFKPEHFARIGARRPSSADDRVPISLCDVMSVMGLGTELVRVRGLLDAIAMRHRQHELEHPPGGGIPPPGPPPGPGGTGTETREELLAQIERRIAGQVADLDEFTAQEQAGPLDDLLKIEAVINRIESGGPANVTAFHDFHTLQVAYSSVWTAAFDERMREAAGTLYETLVQLADDYGVPVPDLAAVRDVNEFRRAISEIQGVAEFLAVEPVPPDVLLVFPQMTQLLWNQLDEGGQTALLNTAGNFLRPYDGNDTNPDVGTLTSRSYIDEKYAEVVRTHRNTPLSRAEELALDLADRLGKPHEFRYYAPGSYNLGLMTTYRQEWWPESYQRGRLVSTIPMAPGEKRAFKISRSREVSRIEREVNKSLVERSQESQMLNRAETDVMNRTATTTNFRLTAQGSISFGIGSVGATSEFGVNQAQESSKQQRSIIESTNKAAQQVRQEREIHVEATSKDTVGSETTHEISNPNNEITVTYLLYELERRYRVRSRLHRVAPVIMVAMEIPAPHQITAGWVLEHSWILRRAMLDNSYDEAIAMIEDGATGLSADVELAKANWTVQRTLTQSLEAAYNDADALLRQKQQALVDLTTSATAATSGATDADDIALGIFTGGLSALFASDDPAQADLLEARRKGAEEALKFNERRIADLKDRLGRARGDMASAGEKLTAALRESRQAQTRIDQLLLHIRQNILHYMHNIWDHRHPDQILFQHAEIDIDMFEPAGARCTLRAPTADEIPGEIPGVVRDGEFFVVECTPPARPDPSDPASSFKTCKLHQVADLDQPMGYKGNYILYRLKTCTYITDYMMQNYIDAHFGLKDPALDTPYDTAELLAYAQQVLNDATTPLTDAERSSLLALVSHQLTTPEFMDDTIIVTTGELFMDALKGGQTLLESFKRAHRGLDVLKVEEEVRASRLRSLQHAAMLLQETPNFNQPAFDRSVVVHDHTGHAVVPVPPDD